jgi:hypothetical protein
MKRRSFLKTVGTASLALGVTPAWGMPQVTNGKDPHPSSSDAHKSPEHVRPKRYY